MEWSWSDTLKHRVTLFYRAPYLSKKFKNPTLFTIYSCPFLLYKFCLTVLNLIFLGLWFILKLHLSNFCFSYLIKNQIRIVFAAMLCDSLGVGLSSFSTLPAGYIFIKKGENSMHPFKKIPYKMTPFLKGAFHIREENLPI